VAIGRVSSFGTAVAASLVVGAAVGLLAAVLAGAMFEQFAIIGFWGSVYGLVTGITAFGAALLRLAQKRWLALVGGYLAAMVLTVAAAGVGLFNLAWGVPILSLSGAWLWPLCLGCALLAGILFWRTGRRHRRAGAYPSGATKTAPDGGPNDAMTAGKGGRGPRSKGRLFSASVIAALLLPVMGGCAEPFVGSQRPSSELSPSQSPSTTASDAASGGCVMLADRAADVLIAAVDATARRYSAGAERPDGPALFTEAGQEVPEVLRRFGAHSGEALLDQAAQTSAQQFLEADCDEDDIALAHLEDRLAAAVRQRVEAMTLAEGRTESATAAEQGTDPPPAAKQTPAATAQVAGAADGVAPDDLAATLLAIMQTTVRPVEVFTVPDGFPAQFPVHTDAEVVSSQSSGGSVQAQWRVPGGPEVFEAIESFYSDGLQTYRAGGWTSGGGPSSVTLGPNDVVAGRRQFNVEGYGYSGSVVVEALSDAQDVIITAALDKA